MNLFLHCLFFISIFALIMSPLLRFHDIRLFMPSLSFSSKTSSPTTTNELFQSTKMMLMQHSSGNRHVNLIILHFDVRVSHWCNVHAMCNENEKVRRIIGMGECKKGIIVNLATLVSSNDFVFNRKHGRNGWSPLTTFGEGSS